jgi:molecular chaperone HscA
VFEVVATGGDAALGGDDFDHLLADWALQQSGRGAVSAQDKGALQMAARAARGAHRPCPCHAAGPLDGGDLRVECRASSSRP